jgi:hypothetical protein
VQLVPRLRRSERQVVEVDQNDHGRDADPHPLDDSLTSPRTTVRGPTFDRPIARPPEPRVRSRSFLATRLVEGAARFVYDSAAGAGAAVPFERIDLLAEGSP